MHSRSVLGGARNPCRRHKRCLNTHFVRRVTSKKTVSYAVGGGVGEVAAAAAAATAALLAVVAALSWVVVLGRGGLGDRKQHTKQTLMPSTFLLI